MNKRTAIITAIPLSLAGVVGAAAFVSQSFTATGTGHTVAAAVQPVSGSVNGMPSNFAPGQHAAITLHVVNPNPFPVKVNTASFTVDPIPGCPTTSFTIDAPAPSTADVPAAGTSDTITAQLNFVNLPSDPQTGCLNQDIVVHASAS